MSRKGAGVAISAKPAVMIAIAVRASVKDGGGARSVRLEIL
jgi:hypothetical protein